MRRQRRQAEEHEERMLALNRRVRDDLPLTSAEHSAWKEWACRPPSSAGKRRKRKKRRKKKTPKASSSLGRARRRQRQCHSCLQCWFCWLRSSSRCVPFSFWQARDARHGRYGTEGLLQVRRHPFRAADADPHGPDYSADHRVSSVGVRFRWSMPLLCWSFLPCCARVDCGSLRSWLVMLVTMRLGCVPLDLRHYVMDWKDSCWGMF